MHAAQVASTPTLARSVSQISSGSTNRPLSRADSLMEDQFPVPPRSMTQTTSTTEADTTVLQLPYPRSQRDNSSPTPQSSWRRVLPPVSAGSIAIGAGGVTLPLSALTFMISPQLAIGQACIATVVLGAGAYLCIRRPTQADPHSQPAWQAEASRSGSTGTMSAVNAGSFVEMGVDVGLAATVETTWSFAAPITNTSDHELVPLLARDTEFAESVSIPHPISLEKLSVIPEEPIPTSEAPGLRFIESPI